MPDYYVVDLARGPAWDSGKARRLQADWDAHGDFMDGLVEEGFVVLGGPIGALDGDEAMLVVNAGSEEEVRKRLSLDPWADGVLSIRDVRPWTIWLRRHERA
ncbi:MAG: YciI family protein [Acidimicrobiales bacterium]